ncbi:MAG: radical SAM protein [Chloroflexi bacterium]|nr:radical SAM protein [Chloroflexota bacterium]
MEKAPSLGIAKNTTLAKLVNLGVTSSISAGIQIDINSAMRRIENGKLRDASLCDHNCTTTMKEKPTGGNYTCPAAISLNSGFLSNSFAPADKILTGIENTISGIRIANERFIQGPFVNYCNNFFVPDEVAAILKKNILEGKIEVNLFGGNPEMHPSIALIISELNKQEYIINFTTTGRRFMRDSKFFDHILESPPQLIALSADDFESVDQIHELMDMTLEDLYKQWRKIPWYYGQRQKAYEAVFLAKRITQEKLNKPKFLFNLVIHQGNISNVESIIRCLADIFPNCRVNPFPAQAAFIYESGSFDKHSIDLFGRFIDEMINAHISESTNLPNQNITKRIHYWLILKAAFEVYKSSPLILSDVLSGNGIWRCYATPGANRYVQIGKSSKYVDKQVAGGHLGCFWNSQTVTYDDEQVWNMSGEGIGEYIAISHNRISSQSTNKCPGCAFPRLMFDIVTSELGIAKDIIPIYLLLRQKYVGY